MIKNEPFHGITVAGSTDTIFAGQTWVAFQNTGAADATITSVNSAGQDVFEFTLISGGTLELGNRNDGNDWARFNINAAGTTVQAIFESQNIPK